jgi:sugar phosphate isomerase/epimerase
MSLNQTATELKKRNDEYIELYHTYAQKEEELNQVHADFTSLNLDLHAIIPMSEDFEVDNRESRQRVANTFLGRIEAQKERINLLKQFIQDKEKMELEKR